MTLRPCTPLRKLAWIVFPLVGFLGCGGPENDDLFEKARGLQTGGDSNVVAGSGGTASLGSGGSQTLTGGASTESGGTSNSGGRASGGNAALGGSSGSGGNQVATGGRMQGCVPSPELCDGVDNNCENGVEDEVCPSECVGGAIQGHGYMFCFNQDLTWQEAHERCAAQGLKLLMPKTSEKNAAVSETAASFSRAMIDWTWIGASADNEDENWAWDTGEAFWSGGAQGAPVGNRFSAWASGEPNEDNEPNCARLVVTSAQWTDRPCSERSPGLICESP